MALALERVRSGDPDPGCLDCGGILKSATVLFGEHLDHADLMRAQSAALEADVFLTLGTSLRVHPAAALPGKAKMRGARFVIANAEETPYDAQADVLLRDPLGAVLTDLVGRVATRALDQAR